MGSKLPMRIVYEEIKMWLPKEERRLLSGYWYLIGEINQQRVYSASELIPLLSTRGSWKSVSEYGDGDSKPDEEFDLESGEKAARQLKTLINDMRRVSCANSRLSERGFITLKLHKHVDDVCIVGLTMRGFDLGRRYSNLWDLTGIWFEAYRTHWIWLIVGFLGGILGSLVVNWLSRQ